MKKFTMLLMGIMMALSLAACTPTTEKQKATESGTAQETQDGEPATAATTGGASDKVPDPTAEELEVVSVYEVNKDANGLYKNMDAVSSLDPMSLVDKLIEYGVLEDGTLALSYEDKDGKAKLDLSQFPSGKEKLTVIAVANTFIENFELDSLELTVNGKAVGGESGALTFVKEYKSIKK